MKPSSLHLRAALMPLALAGLAASPYVPWTELAESDWIYSLATRTSTVDGYAVHYPTPTHELADALLARGDAAAQRHLAEARLALGDRAGAVKALEAWAQASGPEAWAEAARWCAAHHEWPAAFHAAAAALPGLGAEEQRKLADEQIAWADAQPGQADALALRQTRAELFPRDSDVLEEWIRALEDAGQLAQAEAALAKASGLQPEARLLIQAELVADHGDQRRAFLLLDAALDASLNGDAPPFSHDGWKAYRERVDAGASAQPEAWRAALERAFDPRALLRLCGYFQGQERGDAALDLLRQVERRYEPSLERAGWLQLARHYAEIDAVPEAFRARLAGAQKAAGDAAQPDLAALVRLALRAGGRPLAWGSYNDEPYRWAARVDRTPGFWTGGVSFLLTGQDWKEALAHLESEALPERTFRVARALLDELAQRAPAYAELPALRALVMARHVERGEGQAALALLPLVEAGPPDVAGEGRRTALLAMRQVEVPLADEARLYKAQLRQAAADGTAPLLERPSSYYSTYVDSSLPQSRQRFLRHRPAPGQPTYAQILDEALSRLEQRDPTHRAGLDLVLGELDRLPDSQGLWSELAGRLDAWHLDDDMGPRYERAVQRFDGAVWWQRLARWYARRARHAELRRLADDLTQRFRGSELFARVRGMADAVEVPEQPKVGQRIRLVPWADWVRWKALQRFPHSPTVYREAVANVTTPTRDDRRLRAALPVGVQPVVTDDAFLETRRHALLFVDAQERDGYLAAKMKAGTLAAFLEGLDALPQRTPVEERLLLDGWARLSRFERATPAADRLATSYPGDGDVAREALTLHRSLATLEPGHAEPARAAVLRALPALADPSTLVTELGELEQERGRGAEARATWAQLVLREPKSAGRVEELATILWDYGYMQAALDAIEQGRKRLEEPWLLAFEAGVLREELHDIDGAVREYLASDKPNRAQCLCDWFEADQRALRRLSQLAAHARVRRKILARIDALQPGVAADEQALVALLPLPTITQPDTSLDETVDDWIDRADQPNDPVGREQRKAAREGWLPEAREAMTPIGDALLARVLLFAPKATSADLLERLEQWRYALLDARWSKGRDVDFANALLRRRAELAPSEEERVAKEVERARYLFEHGRRAESDALWTALAARVGALPQGAARMRAEVERAGYIERSRGAADAAAEWRALTTRYAWSLGLLEDRLAFLNRNARGAEARQVLEEVAPRAASGHREPLLERLAREALLAQDLPQARRALEHLLGTAELPDGQRLGALHLLARLRLREDAQSDLVALAKAEGGKLQPEHQADLYQQLARAADLETRFAAAQTMWIEALNRRLERDWVRAAYRSSERGGSAAALQAFFERQRERSPRDVRWAVAVRELRLMSHDLEGAIETAKAAVNVRPERESLWREAAELMSRAGRPGDAADYLEGWTRPRPADEGAASWRSSLYAQAGQDDKALAVEQGALAAFERQAPSAPSDASAGQAEGEAEEQAAQAASALDERRARAARRLIGYGLPQKAWKLLCPTDDPRGLAAVGLAVAEQAELALMNDRYLRWLKTAVEDAGDQDVLTPAAAAFLEHAKPEQREELLAFLNTRLFPARVRTWPGDTSALVQWESFADAAGLEVLLRDLLARRYVETRTGPWNPAPPTALVSAVASGILTTNNLGRRAFGQPDVERLWVQYLAERERVDELGSFLAPRWTQLMTRVFGEGPVPQDKPPADWTRWLDDKQTLAAFARSLASQPERMAELQRVFGERRRWDRLWALGARGWNAGVLVTALPDDGREAWFRLWQDPSPSDADPVLKARGQSIEHVSLALGRLVTGRETAATLADPLVVKLRGPRTVGDVLGHDARWIWPEFAPVAAGARVDDGLARVIGNGADNGRLPGLLWGERPGTAWYALETLARYREQSQDAPLVPLEAPGRGQESERTRLAGRLADALGDGALALEIESSGSVSSLDLRRFEGQLKRLLARAKPQAEDALRTEVRRRQAHLDEATYRALRRLAADLGLTTPFELLDPQQPVAAALLAYVCDSQGSAACASLKPGDEVAFRSALARRWNGKERRLAAVDVRFWLDELWATGASASLPRPGLAKLGSPWSQAAEWLASVAAEQRAEALSALRALPDDQALEALWQRSPNAYADVVRLLRLRVRLLKGDDAAAVQLFERLLEEVASTEPLAYASVTLSEPSAEEGEELEAAPEPPSDDVADAFAARLGAWARPFREAHKLPLVADKLKTLLAQRRQEGGVPLGSWRLAFELAAEEDKAALIVELEQAWIRGDALPPREVAEMLALHAPAEAPKWLERWPAEYAYDAVARRARLLVRLKDRDGATAVLVAGRKRGSWTSDEGVRAFDLWRGIAAEPKAGAKPAVMVPATWTAALPFWKRRPGEIAPDLGAHIARHPSDILSARAILRSIQPAEEEPLRRTLVTLQADPATQESEGADDARLVQLRLARGLLTLSPAAAARQLAPALTAESDLRQRRLPAADVDAALYDVAAIAQAAGDAGRVEQAQAALEDRNPAEGARLHGALVGLRSTAAPRAYRLDTNGQPQPIRPRDMDWSLVAAALSAEASR